MDIQKVKSADITILNDEYNRISIKGKICIPVSWIYFQSKACNIKKMDTSKLCESLGGRMVLDVIVNAQRDEDWQSTLRSVDLAVIDIEGGNDKLFNVQGNKVLLYVGDKQVNSLNFKYCLHDGWFKNKEPWPKNVWVEGNYANEYDFNTHALMMVKPYGLKLKKPAIIHKEEELFP